MKITITNAYTWYNKGDAGILLGIVSTLKQIYNNKKLEINVLSFTPDEDKKRYCKDGVITNVYSNILNPRPYKNTKMGKIKAMIKLLFKMLYVEVLLVFNKNELRNKYNSIESICNSDIVIVCGGGFLGGKKFDSLMHIFQIHVNRLLNKNVIIMGASIEPMSSNIVKFCTESVLKKVDYIIAREIITYNYLLTFMNEKKVELAPDMAFMLDDNKKNDKRIDDLKKKSDFVCGLTVRKWTFPNCKNASEKMGNYIQVLCKIIDFFYENYNMRFVFVPQVIVENGNDIVTAQLIKNRLINKDALLIIEDDISPLEIKGLISNFDIFLGTRMHSNIFATSMKIPTVAIAYEKKTNGIMHTVELDDYVVEIDNLTFDELCLKLETCLKNRVEIAKKLVEEIPKIRLEVMEKIQKIVG